MKNDKLNLQKKKMIMLLKFLVIVNTVRVRSLRWHVQGGPEKILLETIVISVNHPVAIRNGLYIFIIIFYCRI